MGIYCTQDHHADIPEIINLSRVASNNERTDARRIFYSRQAYDTSENQVTAAALLPDRTKRLRLLNRQGRDEQELVVQLRSLVDHAFLNVPLYRKLYSEVGYESGSIRTLEDFTKLPILNKQMLLRHSVEERLDGSSSLSYVSRTSGSSGLPLEVAYTDQQYVVSMTNYLWQAEIAMGKPPDPIRWIYNIHHARWWLSSLCGDYRTFALNDLPEFQSLDRHLRHLRPQLLILLPSYLERLIRAGFQPKDYGIEAITTNSEQSTPTERRRYEQLLAVPVRDEYSSVELEQVAFECSHARYHVLQDNVHVEIVDANEKGIGTIVGTNLSAVHMPMIRYAHDDLGQMSTSACTCGAVGPCLENIHGRRNSSFLTVDGRVIPSASLLGIVDDFLVRKGMSINDYRLLQIQHDALELHYVSRDGTELPAMTRTAMHSQLERLFQHKVSMKFESKNELPKSSSYKRQLLISLVGD